MSKMRMIIILTYHLSMWWHKNGLKKAALSSPLNCAWLAHVVERWKALGEGEGSSP